MEQFSRLWSCGVSFVSTVHRGKRKTTAPPVACTEALQPDGHMLFGHIPLQQDFSKKGFFSTLQRFKNTSIAKHINYTVKIGVFLNMLNTMVQLFLALTQKHEKCSCIGHFTALTISPVHFLLHVRKDTGWEMWKKRWGWGYRLSEVILWDCNQAEGRFCICSAASIFRCIGENTCTCCSEHSNIWLIRTQILDEHLRGNKQPACQKSSPNTRQHCWCDIF